MPLRVLRLSRFGEVVEYRVAGPRRLLGHPVEYRHRGVVHRTVVDLPVAYHPVREQPAGDTWLLADPDRPEICAPLHRGDFARAPRWETFTGVKTVAADVAGATRSGRK